MRNCCLHRQKHGWHALAQFHIDIRRAKREKEIKRERERERERGRERETDRERERER